MASLQDKHPKCILDLGCGVGAYGRLIYENVRPLPRMVGVDIWPEYFKSEHGPLYDELICADIFDVVTGKLRVEFDCVLCMDVIEHCERPRARELSDWLLAQPLAYLSTPLFDYKQGIVDGNEYERHLSHFEFDELVGWGWKPLAKVEYDSRGWIGAFKNA